MIYDNISAPSAARPSSRINRLAPQARDDVREVRVLQSAVSVKDRLAIAIIEDAERTRRAQAGPDRGRSDVRQHRHRARDGVRRARAIRSSPMMAETFSIERRKIMRALGAKVILTPAAERGTGMVRKAAESSREKHGWFLARQFENPANPAYHRQTTGPEILQDFAGKRLDYFVTGWGTGGTLTGAGEMIKLARPEMKIIATEPAGARCSAASRWRRTRSRAGRRTSCPTC